MAFTNRCTMLAGAMLLGLAGYGSAWGPDRSDDSINALEAARTRLLTQSEEIARRIEEAKKHREKQTEDSRKDKPVDVSTLDSNSGDTKSPCSKEMVPPSTNIETMAKALERALEECVFEKKHQKRKISHFREKPAMPDVLSEGFYVDRKHESYLRFKFELIVGPKERRLAVQFIDMCDAELYGRRAKPRSPITFPIEGLTRATVVNAFNAEFARDPGKDCFCPEYVATFPNPTAWSPQFKPGYCRHESSAPQHPHMFEGVGGGPASGYTGVGGAAGERPFDAH